MKIIAKQDFGLNGKYYIKGDEIKDLNYEQIVKLNEKGFEPNMETPVGPLWKPS